MAKVSKVRRKSASQRYKIAPQKKAMKTNVCEKKNYSRHSDKKEWKHSTCSVCMEYPHNAVLLLCSSYNKGCRPYMCATSYRYSNCLEQYKKAYTKILSAQNVWSVEDASFKKQEVSELLCPLCRGQVKGWTVVDPARQYFNAKKRTCMQENCSFVGNYKDLRKHVREDHPSARPRQVDPTLKAKWTTLERERERNDVMSTIRSSMPGAIVFGDYVIEGPNRGRIYRNLDDLEGYRGDVFLPIYAGADEDEDDEEDEEEDDDGGVFRFAAANSNLERLIYGRSRRRRAHRSATGER